MSATLEQPQTPTDGKTTSPAPTGFSNTPSVPEGQTGAKQPEAAPPVTKAPEKAAETPKQETAAKPLRGMLDAKPGEKATSERSAPDKYEWKIEGEKEFVGTLTGKFEPAARAAGLSNEQAHEVYNALAEGMRENTQRMFGKWASALEADKDIGGAKLEESLGLAKSIVDKYGDDELRGLMKDAGLQYNPAVVRLLWRIARDVGGDRLVKAPDAPPPRDRAQSMYPNSKMN
jgi:hypothetical protein